MEMGDDSMIQERNDKVPRQGLRQSFGPSTLDPRLFGIRVHPVPSAVNFLPAKTSVPQRAQRSQRTELGCGPRLCRPVRRSLGEGGRPAAATCAIRACEKIQPLEPRTVLRLISQTTRDTAAVRLEVASCLRGARGLDESGEERQSSPTRFTTKLRTLDSRLSTLDSLVSAFIRFHPR
jgi:hypothetical protein